MNSFKRTFGFINAHPLASKHLMASYYSFFKWQLRSRVTNNLQIVKWIGGLKVYAKKGLTGITGNLYTGLHEFNEMAFLLHFVEEGDAFFDVGANLGSYTLLAAGLKKAQCLSFEPAPETFKLLQDNIDLNKLNDHVTCVQSAVGEKVGFISFTQNEDTTNHVIANEADSPDNIKVKVVKLDDYLINKPVLLKIDVEGFESEVIKGAENLLKQPSLKAIIIELNGCGNRYGYRDEDIHQQLKGLGFKPFWYDPFTRDLKALTSFGNFNTIYIRDIEQVKAKVKNAAAFAVFGEMI